MPPASHCANAACGYRLRTGTAAVLAAGAAACPHCGAPRAGAEPPAWAPLVTIATFGEPTLAHLVRSRLEVDGIVAVVSDEHLATLGHLAGVAGVRLQVRRDQVDDALAILRAASEDADTEAAADADWTLDVEPMPDAAPAVHVEPPAHAAPAAAPACPRCGAAGALAARGRGLMARLFGPRHRCPSCGWSWR